MKINSALLFALLIPSLKTEAQNVWVEQANPAVQRLNSVKFVNENFGWAVGGSGEIVNTINGGATWLVQNSGTVRTLHSVHFFDANTGWISGDSGLITRTIDGGITWSVQNTGVLKRMSGIFFIDANTGWAVGESGTIIKTSDGGVSWIPQTSGTNLDLETVNFPNPNTGWAVGPLGIFRTVDGGSNWIQQIGGAGRSVDFLNADTGWVVGGESECFRVSTNPPQFVCNAPKPFIRKTLDGGSTWTQKFLNGSGTLYSVDFINADTGWAVGSSPPWPVALSTTDGGETWVYRDTGVDCGLNEVSLINSNLGWSVGECYPPTKGKIYQLTSTSNGVLPRNASPSLFHFGNGVKFTYRLTEKSRVQANLFETQGRLVRTIIDEVRIAGEYRMTLSTENLSPGLYFLKFKSNNYEKSYKVILR